MKLLSIIFILNLFFIKLSTAGIPQELILMETENHIYGFVQIHTNNDVKVDLSKMNIRSLRKALWSILGARLDQKSIIPSATKIDGKYQHPTTRLLSTNGRVFITDSILDFVDWNSVEKTNPIFTATKRIFDVIDKKDYGPNRDNKIFRSIEMILRLYLFNENKRQKNDISNELLALKRLVAYIKMYESEVLYKASITFILSQTKDGSEGSTEFNLKVESALMSTDELRCLRLLSVI